MRDLVYFRALEATDLERCHSWHNDKGLYETLGGHFHYVSKESEQVWLDGKRAPSSQEINLAICISGADRHVGNIYLRDIDWISRTASMEMFIAEREERSKGYGQSAASQMLTYAFRDLGLKKIHLRVLADNAAAIHVYEKIGFSVEGRLKNHVFKQGSWKDLIMMGIFAEHHGVTKDVG